MKKIIEYLIPGLVQVTVSSALIGYSAEIFLWNVIALFAGAAALILLCIPEFHSQLLDFRGKTEHKSNFMHWGLGILGGTGAAFLMLSMSPTFPETPLGYERSIIFQTVAILISAIFAVSPLAFCGAGSNFISNHENHPSSGFITAAGWLFFGIGVASAIFPWVLLLE